jgi:hypothetical protein
MNFSEISSRELREMFASRLVLPLQVKEVLLLPQHVVRKKPDLPKVQRFFA